MVPAALAALTLWAATAAQAQQRLVPSLPSLTGVLNPSSTDGKTAQQWAVILGKALFWDQQTGSDGVACATCHYNAGADVRLTNQIAPGRQDITVSATAGDSTFGSRRSDTGLVTAGNMPSGRVAGPNLTLQSSDFPLHVLADSTTRTSAVVNYTNDNIGSQGAYAANFVSVSGTTGKETCGTAASDIFHAGGFAARQVSKRNSPTTINAVFNRRLLWDGSANNTFNGVGSFGSRDIKGDVNKRLIVLDSSGVAVLGSLALPDSALASQAVGPILDSLEMSCSGRTMADVGRKMMATGIRPLSKQRIDSTDSAFTGLIDASGKGLAAAHSYSALVKRAFDPKYWNAAGRFTVSNGTLSTVTGARGYTQMEHNWALFWGLSIMMYEATLISDTSEFDGLVTDRVLRIRDTRHGPPFSCTAVGTVDPLLLRGCQIFFSKGPDLSPPAGNCLSCHGPATIFTNAGRTAGSFIPTLAQLTVGGVLGDQPGITDLGFQNTGIRPVFVDRKLGATDPYGFPLSYSVQYSDFLKGMAAGLTQSQALDQYVLDPELRTSIETNTAFLSGITTTTADSKVTVAGASKVPTLRNVALTPPYTSSGMFSTLRQTLKFYNRGGHWREITPGSLDAMGTACTEGDNTGNGADGRQTYDALKSTPQTCHSNVSVGLVALGLLDCEAPGTACDPATDDLAALERFLKSLSDPRVQCDAAPFDHPSLLLPVGHRTRDGNGDGRADENFFELPAAGSAGFDPASGLCIPNSGDLFAAGMQGRIGGALVPLASIHKPKLRRR